jgi:SPX domain
LLKAIKRARSRQGPSSSGSSIRSPDGNEADSEDAHSSPRSPTYGAISPRNTNIGQRSPVPPKPLDHIQTERVDSRSNPTNVSNIPELQTVHTTSGSEDSTTPIVKPGGRKSISSKFSQVSPTNLRQVFESLRRGRMPASDHHRRDPPIIGNDVAFDESELYFLQWLDGEVKKIDDFYQEKENDAAERYKILSAQLDALRRLRDSSRIHGSGGSSQAPSRAETQGNGNGFTPTFLQKPIGRIRASLDGLSSAMPAADHERRSKQPDLIAHPITNTMGYVEYRVARRRLKQAVLEFYRGMELLKGYRLLNRTGLAKILKKFDKTSGRKISPEYNEKLKSVHFDQSEVLENIMDHTEVPSIV